MKTCRLCLQTVPVAFSLFDNGVVHMLESLTAIRIEETDQVTTTCCKCLLHLKRAYAFQQDVIKANQKFNESLGTIIKEEISEVHVKCEADDTYVEEPLFSQDFLKCKICGLSIESNHLNNHITKHFEAEQECDLCDEKFPNLTEFKIHTKLKHQHEARCYVCIDCGTTFKYKPLYNIHIKNAHKRKTIINKPSLKSQRNQTVKKDTTNTTSSTTIYINKKFICEICYKNCRTENLYNKHIAAHETRKECKICGAKIVKCNFSKHMRIHEDSPVVCDICGSTLKNTESLRGHMFYTHGTKKFKCDICDKMFMSKFNLKLHNRSQHTGEKTHMCDICGKSFFSLYHLNNHHKNIHLQLRPHVCKTCDKGFIKKSALRSHERQHTRETPYKCEICGQGFKQNVSLRTHRKSKHNIVEPITCACETCGKEFASDWALKTHMRKLH